MASLAALPLRDMTRRNASLDWGSVDGLYIGSNNKKFSAVPELGKFVTEYLSGTTIKATVPAKSLNFSYCSGLAAVGQAYLDIAAGLRRFTVVGGVGSTAGVDSSLISGAGARSEAGSVKKIPMHRNVRNGGYFVVNMTEKVDRRARLSRRYEISNDTRDAYTLSAIEKGLDARRRGFFDRECMVYKSGDSSSGHYFSDDELEIAIRQASQPLAPVSDQDRVNIDVGQGFSLAAEGACCLLLASDSAIQAMRLRPRVKIIAHATTETPVDSDRPYCLDAIAAVFAASGLSSADMDLFEVNEVCAVEALCVMRELDLPLASSKFNANGGDLAIGEAAGASSARLVVTALNRLHTTQGRYALCAASSENGQGVAIILEKITEN